MKSLHAFDFYMLEMTHANESISLHVLNIITVFKICVYLPLAFTCSLMAALCVVMLSSPCQWYQGIWIDIADTCGAWISYASSVMREWDQRGLNWTSLSIFNLNMQQMTYSNERISLYLWCLHALHIVCKALPWTFRWSVVGIYVQTWHARMTALNAEELGRG